MSKISSFVDSMMEAIAKKIPGRVSTDSPGQVHDCRPENSNGFSAFPASGRLSVLSCNLTGTRGALYLRIEPALDLPAGAHLEIDFNGNDALIRTVRSNGEPIETRMHNWLIFEGETIRIVQRESRPA